MTRFWVGGYGADMTDAGTPPGAAAEGIGFLAGDAGSPATTLSYRGVAVRAASPSWLAAHPSLDVVYAALEGVGAVQAFARSGEAQLTPLGGPVDVGRAVCHVAVSPQGTFAVSSCYGDGRVVRIALDPTGMPVPDPAEHAAELRAALLGEPSPADAAGSVGVGAAASDPHPGEGRSSRAHAAAFLPDGRIATTDLGFDLVRLWRPSGGGLVADHEVVLPQGTGPRHMVVHPSGHLHVVTEYSCEVFTLAPGADGRWAVVSAVVASPAAEFGTDAAAELARSRDGTTLYTALRGSDTIATLRVRDSGDAVEPIALTDAGVQVPRHHRVHEGMLLVAGQGSDTIGLIELDARTGVPRAMRHRTAAPAPTHVLPVR